MGCVMCNHSGKILKSLNGIYYSICKKCSHVYQEDIKSKKYYEELPYDSQWDNYKIHSINRAKYIYDFCKNYIPSNILHLDVGCGWGGPMYYMNSLFKTKKSIGCTVDQDKIKYKKELKIYYKDFSKINNIPKQDFITMVHVLEHFPDPLEALHKLKSILKEGGYAYIEVPSYEWGNIRTKQLFCSVHISYFTYQYLQQLLNNFGFTIVKKKQSKYWGNIKILIKNTPQIPNYNYKLKLIKLKLTRLFMFPIIRLIKKFKKIKPND
jgi:ubiquinone/menaquinone biosynthesis C-methylase UbiE